MRWKRVAQWIWVIGLLGIWALRLNQFVAMSAASQSAPFQGDFAVYLAAARVLRVNPHANIYDVSVLLPYSCGLLAKTHTPYVYPPLLAILLAPVAQLSCGTALFIWQGLNLAVWLVVVVFLLRALPRFRLLLLPLGLFFVPLWTSFYFGQVNEVILLGIIGALWLVERQHQRWAGVVLGVLAAIKLFPIILALYFVLRRKWHVGLAAGATLLASGLLMSAVVGLNGMGDAVRAIMAFRVLTAHHPSNIALLAQHPLATSLLVGLFVVFFAATIHYQDGDLRVGYAWALVTMFLILPVVWEHYFIWLLPAFVALASRHRRHRVLIPLCLVYLPLALVQTPSRLLLTWCVLPLWMIAAGAFVASSSTAMRHLGWVWGQCTNGLRGVWAVLTERALAPQSPDRNSRQSVYR